MDLTEPTVDALRTVESAALRLTCPACVAAREVWRRDGHHLSCRSCEVRAVACASPAARHAFYAALLAKVGSP